jgi:hypothetical protein
VRREPGALESLAATDAFLERLLARLVPRERP